MNKSKVWAETNAFQRLFLAIIKTISHVFTKNILQTKLLLTVSYPLCEMVFFDLFDCFDSTNKTYF